MWRSCGRRSRLPISADPSRRLILVCSLPKPCRSPMISVPPQHPLGPRPPLSTRSKQARFDGPQACCHSGQKILPPFFCPATFVIEAPFGRVATAKVSILTVDGIRSWMRMELVSLVLFVNTYLRSPCTPPPLSHSPHRLASSQMPHPSASVTLQPSSPLHTSTSTVHSSRPSAHPPAPSRTSRSCPPPYFSTLSTAPSWAPTSPLPPPKPSSATPSRARRSGSDSCFGLSVSQAT